MNNDPLQGMTVEEIRALAKKELENVRKRREYQNKWRSNNKNVVAKYNRDYRVKKKRLKAGEDDVRM